VKQFARSARGHRGIENSLHWCLDVVFREDASRMQTGHTSRVFMIFRKIVLNLLNRDRRIKRSVRARRKQAARPASPTTYGLSACSHPQSVTVRFFRVRLTISHQPGGDVSRVRRHRAECCNHRIQYCHVLITLASEE